MPGFISYDNLISAITVSGQILEWHFYKVGPTMHATASWGTHWVASGSPGAGSDTATPGPSGSALINASGSICWPATTPKTKHLIGLGATVSTNATLMIYDRLWCASGFITSSSTGSQLVGTGVLPRSSGGAGVEAWVELTTATTTQATVMCLSGYTNEGGTANRVGANLTFPAAATAVRWAAKLPLATGDSGIRSIESIKVSTSGAAGVFNIVLIRPLAYIPVIANLWNERDLILQPSALPQIYDGASLGIMQLATATNATTIQGLVRVAYN